MGRHDIFTISAVIVAMATLPLAAAAQQRTGFLNQALNETDPARALDLQYRAANPDPALGPLDEEWDRAVFSLATTLLRDPERADVATAWLRWGLRLKPSQDPPQPGAYGDELIAAWNAALETVSQELRSPSGSSQSTFRWGNDPLSGGSVLVTAPGVDGLTLQVNGQNRTPGSPINISWDDIRGGRGTVTISAEAAGYERVEIVADVLPSVTTLITLNPAQIAAPPGGGRGFPVLAVVGIVAAAGGVCALVCFGPDSPVTPDPPTPPGTGGITITFPSNE